MSTNITQLTQESKDFTAKFISILADPLFKKRDLHSGNYKTKSYVKYLQAIQLAPINIVARHFF